LAEGIFMDFKNTINLPQTDFQMQANLTQLEPKILRIWEEGKIYHKILEARKSSPKFILHDGPPYANGDIHIGQGLNKILKDIVLRYKTMQGFLTPFIPGWDCHGLPIEQEIIKKQGKKAQKLSNIEFRKLCFDFAKLYVARQREQFKRLGVLADWDNPYLTIDRAYEAAIIDVFEQLVRGGYVYKKNKPIHWCMKCQTALAEAELEYKNLLSPSIYAKFKLFSTIPVSVLPENTYILVWTTTPWTLPANVAVAVHPDLDYIVGSVGEENYIFCKGALERLGRILPGYFAHFREKQNLKGKMMEGFCYSHPLFSSKSCPVICEKFVTVEDGTGCVHIAPGHGEEDYLSISRHPELNLPILSPVDKEGKFTKEANLPEVIGKNVFDANPIITDILKKSSLLLYEEEISHSYPCCWRCKSPVIFRATEQWFVSVDRNDARQKALCEIEKVQWLPSWGKIRISSMVKERPDWCISRQRKWGVPIPAFYCESCGEVLLKGEVIKHIKELFRKNGSDIWFSATSSELVPKGAKCPKCNGNNFRKEEDILDVWFESAASHNAVCQTYPQLKDHFPADLYLEGTDQHRGWFQVSLIESLLTNGKAPFKTVLTHGFIVDARTGDKLSKSGFLIPVDKIVSKYGADVLRLWVSSLNYTDDIPVSEEIIKGASEPYIKIRNTFRFLLGNLWDFDPSKNAIRYENLREVDKWALMKEAQLISGVTRDFENFEFFKAYHKMLQFCVEEMSALYFAILKDRLYTYNKDSIARRSAQTVLYEILVTITKMFAPIIPHTAEEVWGHIRSKDPTACETICLARWPLLNEKYLNPDLREKFSKLFAVRDEVYKELEKLRAKKVIGSFSSARVELNSSDPRLQELLKTNEKDLPELFITSDVFVREEKPADAVEMEFIKGLFISVKKSPHQKCQRCWNYRDSVGKNEKFPTLCERCVEVIAS